MDRLDRMRAERRNNNRGGFFFVRTFHSKSSNGPTRKVRIMLLQWQTIRLHLGKENRAIKKGHRISRGKAVSYKIRNIG